MFPSLHPDDATISLLSQNVRGFDKWTRSEWLASFKRKHEHGHFDLVFLQETHVGTTTVSAATREQASQRGFRVGVGCPTLSLWSAGTTSSAGVGMLVHPQSQFQDLKPAFDTYWSPHFMAATAVLDGAPVLLFNVYAPADPAQRERFYEQLTPIVIPEDTHLYVGGDFNCTQGGLADQSYETYADRHSSDGLTLLAHQWRLHDSLATSMPALEDKVGLKRFYDAHHTHQYTVTGRGLAASHLDRWYANDVARPWMVSTQVDQEGFHSDNRGVALHLRSPTNPIRIRKEKRVFPVPAYARERADQFVKHELEHLRERLAASLLSARESADLWDATKVRIRTGLLQVQRAATRSRRNTYRKKIRRMYGRLRVAMENARVEVVDASGGGPRASPAQATVAHLTRQIATIKREWVRAKSCSLFQKHTWRPGKTTKQFFKRISCKFGDNLIPTLRSPNGQGITDSQAKAETLADAWSSIMQGDATPPEAASRVVQWMEKDTGDDTAALGSSDLITEQAVAAALQACKADKACGGTTLSVFAPLG